MSPPLFLTKQDALSLMEYAPLLVLVVMQPLEGRYNQVVVYIKSDLRHHWQVRFDEP